MSAPAQQSAVVKELETRLRPALEKLQKDHDQQLPQLRALIDRLTVAMKKNDAKALQEYRAPFDEHVKLATGLVARGSKLADDAKKLAAKTADDTKAAKDFGAKLTKLQTILDANLLKLKGAQDQLQDAFEKASGAGNKYVEMYARLEDLLDRYLANCQWRIKQYKGFLDKAKAAAADRDRKSLPELKTKAAEFRAGKPPHSEAQAALAQFSGTKMAGMDEHAREQFQRELPRFKKMLEQGTELEAEVFQLHSKLEALKIDPVDKAKAVKVLKIPPEEAQTFGDVLGLKVSGMEKYLDDLGKRLKPVRTGKQLLAELRNAKLI